jgi:hypothetical protein
MAWGNSDSGGTNAPVNGSYAKIYANNHAFAALKADGTIVAWGKKGFGGPNEVTLPPDLSSPKLWLNHGF